MGRKKVVVLDVVGLQRKHLESPADIPNISELFRSGKHAKLKPVFPAVTLPVQASLTTGVYPETHGVVANGFYFPENYQVSFWEQSASLVGHQRIWERLKKKDPSLRTALLFMQNSLYADCDVVITPKPFHTDDGFIPWCYSKPINFYEEICQTIGEFSLMHYWGPLASIESSRWIARAAVETMARRNPDLMFVYLPHLDYCMQKFGPEAEEIRAELRAVDHEVGRVFKGIKDLGYADDTTFMIVSEYAFHQVQGDIPINRILRHHDLQAVRTINGREYLDIEMSHAVAMVDHQVAHVYIKPGYIDSVRDVLEKTEGIDMVLHGKQKNDMFIDHPRSGEIIAVSARDKWFSYYWWDEKSREPDFAGHVDIHRKPGYDPLELFLEPGTRNISQDTSLIKGSHGYPPIGDEDFVPIIVSDSHGSQPELPEEIDLVDVQRLIETIICSDGDPERVEIAD